MKDIQSDIRNYLDIELSRVILNQIRIGYSTIDSTRAAIEFNIFSVLDNIIELINIQTEDQWNNYSTK